MSKRRSKTGKREDRSSKQRNDAGGQVRIVGGDFRGRRLAHLDTVGVRPMKDRTREAVFNLIGPSVRGCRVLDLFAGTGAMALESLSRGASSAVLIERHARATAAIADSIATLEVADRTELIRSDTFFWGRRFTQADRPDHELGSDDRWLVFCCPPYVFYQERFDDLVKLLTSMREAAPPQSQFVVEAERPFDFNRIWTAAWKTRDYAPAAIGIYVTEHEPTGGTPEGSD